LLCRFVVDDKNNMARQSQPFGKQLVIEIYKNKFINYRAVKLNKVWQK